MDLPAIVGQVLLLCSLALAGLVVARVVRLEYALVCVLAGFTFGQILPWLMLDTGIRASNFADIIFYLLLPPLIFEAGWQLEPDRLRRWLPLILLLAVFGLLVATLVGALLLFFGIGHASGFPLIAAVLTACLLAPTDPGTVIHQLRSNQAPPDLALVMEGESLFNDATAVVLFGVILAFALGSETSTAALPMAALSFAVKFGGGLLVGVVCGAVSTLLMRLVVDGPGRNLVLLLSIFGSFYAGEHLAGVGVMAVLACALLLRRSAGLPAYQSTLNWLSLLCSALLFTLMGLAIEPAMFAERWFAMLLGIAAALLARTVAVYLSLVLARPLSANHLEWSFAPLLVGGGLRGVVTIALALSLPTELDYWWTIQSIAFGVVAFNLFAQGPANGLLLKYTLRRSTT